MERNNELRDLVERRLQGTVSYSGYSSGRQSVQREDRLHLQQIETELLKVVAENQAMKSQQQKTERLLEAAQQKSARSYISSFGFFSNFSLVNFLHSNLHRWALLVFCLTFFLHQIYVLIP